MKILTPCKVIVGKPREIKPSLREFEGCWRMKKRSTHRIKMTARTQFEMGSAPAPGAANDALVVGTVACANGNISRIQCGSRANVRREGASNRSRGGCAPQ